MNRKIHTYGTQQVMTSDPVTLVALLYDKAVMSLKAAIRAIQDGEIEARWRANNKAVEIINHLLMTLDMEKGGEVASNLEAVYGYMLRRLLDVDMHNDPRAAEEVIQLLDPLRASWAELARANGNGSAETPSARALAGDIIEPAKRPASPTGTAEGGGQAPAEPAGRVFLSA